MDSLGSLMQKTQDLSLKKSPKDVQILYFEFQENMMILSWKESLKVAVQLAKDEEAKTFWLVLKSVIKHLVM